MALTAEDHALVAAAIAEAEKKTSAQFVCVFTRASPEYVHIPIIWATVLALLTPWPLIQFTEWSVERIFLTQLVVFIVVALILSWRPLRLALVPGAVRRARAHRAALEQFVLRRVGHTKHRTGVLIFVSLAERYARIVADEGIAEKINASEWQSAVDALINHMREGRVAAGFAAAIERCVAIAAAHAPPDGSPNELPNRLYVT